MISVVVLAAGTSKRMGDRNKLLLPVSGQSMIRHTVQNLVTSDAGEILVVLGYDNQKICASLIGLPVIFIYNKEYTSGMTSSILCGIRHLSSKSNGMLLCLGDQPFITPEIIREFVHNPVDSQKIIRGRCNGSPVHPTLFPKEVFPLFRRVTNKNGCKEIFQMFTGDVEYIDYPENQAYDIDHPKDYERLISSGPAS